MKCEQLLLVAGFTITLSLRALGADAVPVLPGEYKTGDLQASEQDTYAFSANAGDAVTVLAGVDSGSFDPEVELRGPDGAVVATAWGSSDATIQAVKVTVTGTYLIAVRDHWAKYAGGYGLTVITNPGLNPGEEDGSPISPGEHVTGDIVAGDMDAYHFWAHAGDTLTILAGVGSGSFDPEVQLHGPDGAVLATAWGSSEGTIQGVKVTVAGAYLIVVRDYWGTYAGSYGLTAIANPGSNASDEDGRAVEPGEYVVANIASGDMDVYTLSANVGDALTILVGVDSGSFDPEVQVHSPDGSMLATAWGSSEGTVEAVKAPVTGTYLIVVRDYWGTYSGGYGLTVATNPGPNRGDGDGGPIRSGEAFTAALAAGDMDVYNFWANAGDAVTVLAKVESGSFDPQAELHGPDGNVVSTAWGSSEAAIQARVTLTGTYLIFVRDHWGTYDGEYSLSLAREMRAGTPAVGMVWPEPDVLVRGEDLTLWAEDVSDANGAIARVEFWYDYRWNGYLEPDGSDVLLGSDSNGVDGWSWSGSTRRFVAGFFEVVFARALDKEGLWSDEAGIFVWVLPAGGLNGDLFIDALDLQDFASHWLQAECTGPDWCDGADIDHSGTVDLLDFAQIGWDWQ